MTKGGLSAHIPAGGRARVFGLLPVLFMSERSKAYRAVEKEKAAEGGGSWVAVGRVTP